MFYFFMRFFYILIFFIIFNIIQLFNCFANCNFFSKSKVYIGFSPYDKTEKIILNLIKSCKSELLLAAYNFNNKKIYDALLKAHKKGVNIKIILDGKLFDKNKNKNKLLKSLYILKIPIKLNYSYNIMHNKFIVIDEESIETGSYNYTKSAPKYNAENIIILKCVPKIALKYKKEFLKL